MLPHIEIGNNAKEALQLYCPASLWQESQTMNKDQQRALLQAMVEAARDTAFQYEQQMEMKGGRRENFSRVTNKSCPLFRALVDYGCRPDSITQEALEATIGHLSRWGSTDTSDNTLFQYQHIHTTKSVIKRGGTAPKWNRLKKIGIRDLSLFGTTWGCCLEGIIVGEPIQPFVGGTFLLQDMLGEFIVVCFYNVLPDRITGSTAEPLLKKKFPLGATVRVAEPFLKIFRDGTRGIRVDNPSEIKVTSSKITTKDSSSLIESKKQGNKFMSELCYDAAIDVYLEALRSTDLVPTILSNRAQAFIGAQQWDSALCDAAASLTIRPKSDKTWTRYRLCLDKLSDRKEKSAPYSKGLFKKILPGLPLPVIETLDVKAGDDIEQAQELKVAGNTAFKKKDYGKAIDLYSRALLVAGATVRALLSNWALGALESGATGDAIAAAAASLRIQVDDKAVYRLSKGLAFLGEYELAIITLDVFEKGMSLPTLYSEATKMQKMISSGAICDFSRLSRDSPFLLANWAGPIETFKTKSKGRGLRATRDIAKGEVILIERPLAFSEFDPDGPTNDIVFSLNVGSVDKTTQYKLKASLCHRSRYDGVLNSILNSLPDGSKNKPLVPVSELMLSLNMFSPLLPGHRDYLEGDDNMRQDLGTELIEQIVKMNTHGSNNKDDKKLWEGTKMFAVINMMNHSNKPNCGFVRIPDNEVKAAAIAVTEDIKQGVELTMQYLKADEAVVKERWNL